MKIIFKKNLEKYFLGGVILATLIVFPVKILAYQIEKVNLAGTPSGDFVLGPGKIELQMDSGEKATKVIFITNRIAGEMNFKIATEDFKGSHDMENTVILLGEEKGPYSLKDCLKPEVSEFTLKYGEKITIPVEISIPKNAEPGGLYGSVIVETNPIADKQQSGKEGVKIVSRIGALFFVKISGNVIESAGLKDFRTNRFFYEKGPILFNIAMENKGSAHLVPYGIIEIKDMLGRVAGIVEADPWFVMPDSIRTREIKWDGNWLFGRYGASLKVNRGYQDIVDEKTIYFLVLPWKILAIAGAGIILAGAIIFIVRRKSKIKNQNGK